MCIGMHGSGLMGDKLGTLFARAGHEVVFNSARGTERLQRFARDAGGKARAGTPRPFCLLVAQLTCEEKRGRNWRIASSGSGNRRIRG